MGFKDIVRRDLDILINARELAEEHVINGQQVLISVDSDRLSRRTQGDLAGLTNCDILFFCKKSDLAFEPSPGSALEYDNRYAVIMSVGEDSGMYEIILRFNRGD